jgi:hypothetical protein
MGLEGADPLLLAMAKLIPAAKEMQTAKEMKKEAGKETANRMVKEATRAMGMVAKKEMEEEAGKATANRMGRVMNSDAPSKNTRPIGNMTNLIQIQAKLREFQFKEALWDIN